MIMFIYPCQSEIIKQIEMNTLKLSFIICLSILYSLASFAERKSNVGIKIGSFDSIPSEIDGGCCVFYKYPSKVRNKGYIMVNNLATTAYMMVNRHLEEFTLVANKKDVFWYKNKKFTLKVTINSTQSKGYSESYNVKGILIVEDHNKNRRKLAFCGNCGW
ncbi:hypothetical protein HMPREF0658_0307 [Hoylesella marshii DSM 16973 = JCM 13450]|uniref:Uncharacterized protein n=2 Tax=Hoylesella marshii TaxID=189722 RepID=E0NQ56_9BACT|nr:hypothetical protein HMPREF0658_0307 [Hoylesella marshii DSM 16973 = JCM 13450]